MKFKNLTLRLHSGKAGFTLIELIIVIAIIALLAAATFVAVNPAKRIGDANNAQRWSDVSAVADAWATYIADNTGTAATTVTNGVTYAIATTTKAHSATCGATTTTAIVNMNALVTGGYVGQIPSDPSTASSNTEYYFYTDGNAMKFGACDTYNSATINVIR
jgi:prepilin-type N-terminal cleavage/methylation domain-containing protein